MTLEAKWDKAPEDEPEECPICGQSFFTGVCSGCGYDEAEDGEYLQGLLDDYEEDLKK